MNEISTEVISHMIIFKDRSRMEISAKQREEIAEYKKNPNIHDVDIRDIHGVKQLISLDTIGKILSWDEFLDQYPDIVQDHRVYSAPEPNYESPEDQFIFDETWRYLESQNNVYRELTNVDRVMLYDKFRKNDGKDFNSFLKSEGAINKHGFVILDWRRSDKKGTYWICQKFPVFTAMRKFQQLYREKKKEQKEYAIKKQLELVPPVEK